MAKIFAGLLLAVLKFQFGIGSIIVFSTEFLGFFLIYLGCRELLHTTDKFETPANLSLLSAFISAAAAVIGVVSMLFRGIFLLSVISTLLGIVISAAELGCTILYIVITYMLIDAVSEIEIRYHLNLNAPNIKTAWLIMAAGQLISSVLRHIHLGFFGVPASIAAFAASIYLLVCFWRIKVAFDAMRI